MRKFWLPTLAALLLVPAFCALGLWQLHRAQEKRTLQAEYDRRATRPPIPLTAELRTADDLQFFPVQAQGTYEMEYQLLWDNRIHHGIAGYHVLTPFHIAGGDTRVLINRGWVPMDPDRNKLPATDAPRATLTIRGVAVVPRQEFSLGALDPLTRTGITVWQQLDLARYAKQVDWPLQPVVILLDPQSPGGYVREWARLDTGIAMHQGYAFQWFMLAVVVVVLYIVLLVRAVGRARRTREGNGA